MAAPTKDASKLKRALVVLAEGAEEMEVVITTDVLRRAGVQVTLAGLDSSQPVKCSRGVVIVPDTSLAKAVEEGPHDVVVLPGGGGGAKRLSSSEKVKELLREAEAEQRVVAAVCAGPTALVAHGVAVGKEITSHPSVKQVIEESGRYVYSEARVVRDGSVITSRGPGTCFEFALCIVECLCGSDTARDVASPMILNL